MSPSEHFSTKAWITAEERMKEWKNAERERSAFTPLNVSESLWNLVDAFHSFSFDWKITWITARTSLHRYVFKSPEVSPVYLQTHLSQESARSRPARTCARFPRLLWQNGSAHLRFHLLFLFHPLLFLLQSSLKRKREKKRGRERERVNVRELSSNVIRVFL